jgi:hypothetical protein
MTLERSPILYQPRQPTGPKHRRPGAARSRFASYQVCRLAWETPYEMCEGEPGVHRSHLSSAHGRSRAAPRATPPGGRGPRPADAAKSPGAAVEGRGLFVQGDLPDHRVEPYEGLAPRPARTFASCGESLFTSRNASGTSAARAQMSMYRSLPRTSARISAIALLRAARRRSVPWALAILPATTLRTSSSHSRAASRPGSALHSSTSAPA